jgi:hypothetical protein
MLFLTFIDRCKPVFSATVVAAFSICAFNAFAFNVARGNTQNFIIFIYPCIGEYLQKLALVGLDGVVFCPLLDF